MTRSIWQSEVEEHQIWGILTKLSESGHHAPGVIDTVASIGKVKREEVGDIWTVFNDEQVEDGHRFIVQH